MTKQDYRSRPPEQLDLFVSAYQHRLKAAWDVLSDPVMHERMLKLARVMDPLLAKAEWRVNQTKRGASAPSSDASSRKDWTRSAA